MVCFLDFVNLEFYRDVKLYRFESQMREICAEGILSTTLANMTF